MERDEARALVDTVNDGLNELMDNMREAWKKALIHSGEYDVVEGRQVTLMEPLALDPEGRANYLTALEEAQGDAHLLIGYLSAAKQQGFAMEGAAQMEYTRARMIIRRWNKERDTIFNAIRNEED